MTERVTSVEPDTPLEVVARTLVSGRFGGVPVVDRDGRVLGFLSEGDLVAALLHDAGPDSPARDVMTTPVLVDEFETTDDVLGVFMTWRYVIEPEDVLHANRVRAEAMRKNLDIAGIVLMCMAVATLQYVLEEGPRADWFDSTRIAIATAVAAISGAGFVIRERDTAPHGGSEHVKRITGTELCVAPQKGSHQGRTQMTTAATRGNYRHPLTRTATRNPA